MTCIDVLTDDVSSDDVINEVVYCGNYWMMIMHMIVCILYMLLKVVNF